MLTRFQAPVRGLSVLNTFPAPSPAKHFFVEAHDREAIHPAGSRSQRVHAALPPVGFTAVRKLPPASPATHNAGDGHETACRWLTSPKGAVVSIATGERHCSVPGVQPASTTAPTSRQDS